MAWIEITGEEEAKGLLAAIYESAIKRAGRVYNILKIQSRSPLALQKCMELYAATMKSESTLTRAQREMLAVVVSRINECRY